MISLVKNELIKIFHQKSIYVIGIIIVFTTLLGGILGLILNNFDLLSEDFQINTYESLLNSYDINNPDEQNYYIDLKTEIDVLKDQKQFKEQYKKNYVYSLATDSIRCENESKIAKDEEKLKECSEEHKRIFDEIKNNDWKYFINKEIEEDNKKLEEIGEIGSIINEATVEEIKLNIEINRYLLDNNISPEDEAAMEVVNDYRNYRFLYMSKNHDEKSYVNKNDLEDYLTIKENYFKYEYMYKNKIYYSQFGTLSSIANQSNVAFFVILLIALISGTIVSKEFSKGTIKQLLVRPHSRTKILFSKLFASIIIFLIALIFYDVVHIINEMIFGNVKEIFMPVVEYNYSLGKAVEVNLFIVLFVNTLKVMPCYLIILSASFFGSTVTKNDSLGILCGIGLYFGANIINVFLSMKETFLSKIAPSMCWNLSPYLTLGKGLTNIILPLAIDIATVAVLLIVSTIVFNRVNVKNQ